MESTEPLVYLTTVVGSVAGQLVVGRLRAEGIAATMCGPPDGPYPFPAEIDVLVASADLVRAREVLLADAVEATFEARGAPVVPRLGRRKTGSRRRPFRRRRGC
ncbi:MAG TPA: hypothetical protein VED84_03180 [Acidimicrobiales bacterium]|nr:hypothetical protein [Acidimicrobiales bacterium]